MEKIKSKRVMLYSVLIMGIVLVAVGISYAYFTTMSNSNKQIVNSGTLEIAYQNTKNISTSGLMPTTEDEASIHQFTITNTGTLDTTYKISMIDIQLLKNNTPTTSANLKWALYETNGNYQEENLIRNGSFSSENGYQQGDSEYVIVTDLPLAVNENQSYVLKIWLQEIGTVQNDDQGLSLNFKIEVDTLVKEETAGIKSILKERESEDSTENFYAYSDSIDKMIIQNQLNPIQGATMQWDVSATNDESVMAYLVENASGGTYTLYLQGNDRIYFPENSSYLFLGFSQLTTIEGLNYVDTTQTIDMHGMFKNCDQLVSLDLQSFDTSQVTLLDSMFTGCEKLSYLNISSFNTQQVTNMNYMFSQCYALESIDVTHFDTSKVESMEGMFDGCVLFTELDLSSFVTAKVINMGAMFAYCERLATLDLRQMDFSAVTDSENLFHNLGETADTLTIIVKDEEARAFVQALLETPDTVTVTLVSEL